MSFDIEKMKADGVSEHLIYLATVAPEVLLLRVARRLENDRMFQQFMLAQADDIVKIYPYAVAAKLMSESDREWLIDEENLYNLNRKRSFKLEPMDLYDGDDGTVLAHKLTEEEYTYFFNPPVEKICNVTYSGTFLEGRDDEEPTAEVINNDSFITWKYTSEEDDYYSYTSTLETFHFELEKIGENKYLVARGTIASHGYYSDHFLKDDITINYQIKDGYKIYILKNDGDTTDRISVPLGDSWTVDTEFSLTDGTNTYNTGDAITPTQDMFLEPA